MTKDIAFALQLSPGSDDPSRVELPVPLSAGRANGRLVHADDALDRGTVDRIEELHAAVARAEAAQRFGLFRGKKSSELADAEAAEVAYLNACGFADYTDYRLRIRRSMVTSPRADDGTGPVQAPPVPQASASTSEVTVPSRPSGADAGEDPPSRRLVAEFRGLEQAYEAFLMRLRAETDDLVRRRLQFAERCASEAFEAAAREAADLLTRASVMHDNVVAVTEDVAQRWRAVLAAMDVALASGEAYRPR